MEVAQSNLLNQLNIGLAVFGIGTLLLLVILIVYAIVYINRRNKMCKQNRITLPIVWVGMLVVAVLVATLFTDYLQDWRYVKQNEFLQIEGELIGYSKHRYIDDVTAHRSWPIFRDKNTQKELSLNILNSEQKLDIGTQYTVVYLPNTKLAEIIE